MDAIDPRDLAVWAQGEWRNGMPARVAGLTNDSRKAEPGQLFAALRTAVRDGHDFIAAAAAAGASGAVVERLIGDCDLPQLQVGDVGAALLRMAKGFRSSWSGQVVGITGSCGKTSCKELLACLLANEPTLSTPGNLNNLIGVPMSILRPAGARCQYAVLEAGISEPGEMALMAEAIDPDFGIITAVGPAHLEALKTVENVAREKGKLLQGSRLRHGFIGATVEPYRALIGCPEATLVAAEAKLSRDWSYAYRPSGSRSVLQQRLGGEVATFEYEGSGVGLASNAALALAVAYTLGRSVEQLQRALLRYRPSQMRNEWRELDGRRVFLDCYNANPVSMQDSLATFVQQTPAEQPRLFLVGCMEELGEEAASWHERLGRELPLRKEDLLLVIGSEASSVVRGMKSAGGDTGNCVVIERIEQAKDSLAGFCGSVFLKGSRRYRLEAALAYLNGGVAC